MKISRPSEQLFSRTRFWGVAAVLLCFAVLGWLRHLDNTGEDLASSYVACRLLADHQGAHLYSHSSTDFSRVEDPVWDATAEQTGYRPLRLLHPYVQIPLWAYSLQPLCTRMNFRPFFQGFLLLPMLCLSGTLWIVARYWTPGLFQPAWVLVVCFGLYRSEPFKYAVFLGQTHILYVFLTVLALFLAEHRKTGWAGTSLALAAAVKITPGFLVLYWIVTRRYRAAASFLVASAFLFATNLALVGPVLTRAYLTSLSQNAHVLLLAFNNQSFAAWWTGLSHPRSAALHWDIYTMPRGVQAVSVILTVASCVAGAVMDRKAKRGESADLQPAPSGGIFAVLGVTLFAPIAWTHYFLVLVIPVMIFAESILHRRSWFLVGSIAAIFLLNLYPLSFGSVHFQYTGLTVIRSQFYAGILAMAGLAYSSVRRATGYKFIGLPVADNLLQAAPPVMSSPRFHAT